MSQVIKCSPGQMLRNLSLVSGELLLTIALASFGSKLCHCAQTFSSGQVFWEEISKQKCSLKEDIKTTQCYTCLLSKCFMWKSKLSINLKHLDGSKLLWCITKLKDNSGLFSCSFIIIFLNLLWFGL